MLESAMPRRYGVSYTTSQLLLKRDILHQYALGWRLVGPGVVPVKRVPISDESPRQPSPKKKARGVSASPPLSSSMMGLHLVLNTKRARTHMYQIGSRMSICDFFECGTPSKPKADAVFLT